MKFFANKDSESIDRSRLADVAGHWLRKYIVFAFALVLLSLAVLLFLEAGLGSDSVTVFVDGLHTAMGWNFATSSAVFNITLIVLGLIFARKYIGVGSVLSLFHMTLFLAIFEYVIPLLKIGELGFGLRFLIFALGQSLLCLAVSLVIVSNFGMSAIDALISQMESKTHIPYFWLRTAMDVMLLVTGTLLGGVFGIGTVISTLLTGFMIDRFRRLLSGPVDPFVQGRPKQNV